MLYQNCLHAAAITFCFGLLGACQEPNAVPSPATVAPVNTPKETPVESPSTNAGPVGATTSPQADSQPSELCNIEKIDGKPFTPNPSPVSGLFVIRGWLGDSSGQKPVAATAVLRRDGSDENILVPIAVDGDRPDVEAYFPDHKGLAKSGFETTIDLSSQAPGEFHIFLAYTMDGRGHTCDNGRRVQLLSH
jgi:hypothetical protein